MKSAYYASAFGGHGTGSRSRRAQIAESQGKDPATRAAKTWGFKSAAALRRWVPSCEWHHVGKYAAIVEYFDVEKWIEARDFACFADLVGLAADLTQRGKELVLIPLVAGGVESALDCSDSNCMADWFAGKFHRAYPRPKSREEAIRRNDTKRNADFWKPFGQGGTRKIK